MFMKVDFHIHTCSTKKDEAESRNCPSAEFFVNALSGKKVSLCAITNHNFFDFEQYQEYSNLAKKSDICVLPGIELDVELLKNRDRGHCIVVANPSKINEFINICSSEGLLDKTKANDYFVKITDLVNLFKNFDGIFITHYGSKDKNFSDDDVDYLKDNLHNNVVLVEPTNLISCFIYLAHNKNSMVGSDCQDWNNYPGPNKDLPELKVPIADYDKLKLLFGKDESIIKNELDNKKVPSDISFTDETYKDLKLSLTLYKDINIVFGGKSTGKSIILNNIKNELIKNGQSENISVYSVADKRNDFEQTIRYSPSLDELKKAVNFNINESIKNVKNFSFPHTKNIIPDIRNFLNRKKGQLEKKIGFVNCSKKFDFDNNAFVKELEDLKNKNENIYNFKAKEYLDYLDEKEAELFLTLVEKIKMILFEKYKNVFVKEISKKMANDAIADFKTIFTNNKATPTKPNDCGFLTFYEKIKNFDDDILNIYTFLNRTDIVNQRYLCDLDKKGCIFRKEIISTNPYNLNKDFSFISSNTGIGKLKEFKKWITKVFNSKSDFINYKLDTAKLITFLKDHDNAFLSDCANMIAYNSFLIKADGTTFNPSSGEQSIILLGKALNDDKDFYILDEPELSVGHDYINRVIITKLKELSKKNKTVIVSTHDANIAVRTLPYTCIFREENADGTYSTFIGNPFSNVLKEVDGTRVKDWKEQTLETLEGGQEAFGEREVAYGK